MESGIVAGEKKQTNALPIGHLLHYGRYRIIRVLGEGGYGITYEALDLKTGQRIAIKEFFPIYAFRRGPNGVDAIFCKPNKATELPHLKMRFKEEGKLLHALKDVKEIVNVYHSFEDNQTEYYTMELLHGMDMQKWLQTNGCMSWQKLSPMVIQIIRALYAVHQQEYIHRDITPDNIFILNDGTVRLIDFGNARRYIDSEGMTAIAKDKFAPREQYTVNGRQGPWTDIYSLCVTIYYAMTGILPKKATERSFETDELPPLHTRVKIPAEVSRAVQVGMYTNENRRYQNMADFAYAMYPKQSILESMIRKYTQPTIPKRINATGETVPMLVCTRGIMEGFRVRLRADDIQTLGRGKGKDIQYLEDTVGVSRNQCSVVLKSNGIVFVRDDHSSYGTMVNGYLLPGGSWHPIQRGETLSFGKEVYVLY